MKTAAAVLTETQTYIPSPTVSAFDLGPVTIHFYALSILAGIVVAAYLTERRFVARGAERGTAFDIVVWAVPFGVVGGRIYHVITDPQLYFAPGRNPWDALKIWEGGLGIWGAVALGALGAWIGCRRHNVSFLAFADSAAPGVLFAQALGRWGNWFNNELYGESTTVPWKLEIHEMSAGRAVLDAAGNPVVLGYFHPTFLYESLWALAAGLILLLVDRKRNIGAGGISALYIVLYTAGRFFIELMRSDTANLILGLRVNTWVSGLLFVIALLVFIQRKNYGRSRAHPNEGQIEPADGSPAESR
ncbi:prolipoprotein diacylglyceryl transferase [Arthrobacter roseus]|uniref:prolipoprotein diacylglyceryl transferase n=1 Tax=Arthrobacter roseus TaxID=136274 RepID=UPI0019627DF5|nr:prolipoprotein diacylglyceryl transferase [Arthrobacter roseus]MBM7846803.1 prolipoprotein diacylglyceryl transferase [Arthrobacter roseus]